MESAFSILWYSFMAGEDSRLAGTSWGPEGGGGGGQDRVWLRKGLIVLHLA